ncbi:MAG TPA: undecaprenyl-phosphate glucose phosphotransferase [Gammaproteobacteria bacterium]|nr:undecaprenyl-phosphate glucose phosphotransferase [Gammaproteobacteria bacterium]
MTPQSAALRLQTAPTNAASGIRMVLDSVIAVAVLLVAARAFDAPLGREYAFLALLVFAMMFPSRPERAEVVIARWTLILTLLLALGWASQTLSAFDARVVVAWALATPAVMIAAQRWLPTVLARVAARDGARRTAVIAGANEAGRHLAERIAADPSLGIRLVGFFDDREISRLNGVEPSQILGPITSLAGFVKTRGVDLIYSALPLCGQPRVRALLEDLRDTTASVYFVPDVSAFDPIQAQISSIAGVPVIAVCESPCCGFAAVLKRVSDAAAATLGLVLLAPLLLLIAVGVKASSPGPVLFKQRRYGLDGKEFVVYKFRTMTCLEDGDVVNQAVRNDPRTTKLGAFLRNYSLDELPQLVNVIQGRMSLVGPRPHAVAHNELYRKLIRGYMIRHKVRPGITGLAQVRGLRGETDSVAKMRARIECDLEYLRNWSLALDVWILVKTFGVVARRHNAW